MFVCDVWGTVERDVPFPTPRLHREYYAFPYEVDIPIANEATKLEWQSVHTGVSPIRALCIAWEPMPGAGLNITTREGSRFATSVISGRPELAS